MHSSTPTCMPQSSVLTQFHVLITSLHLTNPPAYSSAVCSLLSLNNSHLVQQWLPAFRSDQHGSHPLSRLPQLPPSPCPWCFNPSRGNSCAYENKTKRCFGISNPPVPQEKKINQQKHHDQSSHQDKGRLPCLKR